MRAPKRKPMALCRSVIVGLILGAISFSASAQQVATPGEGARHLYYIGLGLYSEQWSENDVVDLAARLQSGSRYHVMPTVASNSAPARRRYPVADDATIAALVGAAARQAGANDLVFVSISTHGAPKVLARKVGNAAPTELSSRELARKLAPLAGRPTIIAVSACYSGSLIDDLQAPERIIITAARADRSSFGCSPGSRHTLFGDAELQAFAQPDRSLRQIFAAIREDVARMEAQQRYRPSEPQIWVGSAATGLYDAPVF